MEDCAQHASRRLRSAEVWTRVEIGLSEIVVVDQGDLGELHDARKG